MNRYKIKYDTIVELFFWMTLLLFSTHDSLIRLIPMIPWRSIEYLSLLIFVILAIISKKRNLKIIPFLIFIYAIVIISILFGTEQQIAFIKDKFLTIPSFIRLWVYLILFSQINYKKINKGILSIAYINMLLLIITTVNGLYSSVGRDINYLGIGMTGAVWIPIIIQAAFKSKNKKKQIIYIISSIIFSVFILIYGNRGSILAIFLFMVYCIFHYTSINKKIWILVLLTILFIIIFYNNDAILNLIIKIVDSFGVGSRNLHLLLNNQITYSTHRVDQIWVNVYAGIKENWLTGRGLCYDRVINGSEDIYAHNLILEIWLTFGVIFGSILLITYFMKGIKLCFDKKNEEMSNLIAPFFITSSALLMFNSSFCQFSFFWIFYGIILSQRNEKKKVGEK